MVHKFLYSWGWTREREHDWMNRVEKFGEESSPMFPARVIGQEHHVYFLGTEKNDAQDGGIHCNAGSPGLERARISGHFESGISTPAEYPAVGDWVAARHEQGETIIESILPRGSGLQRWAAGRKTEQQWMVSNLDYLLLVFALDGGRNFLESMLERSLTVAWNSGAKPIIVLNKLDSAATEHARTTIAMAEELAFGVPVCAVSAHSGEGIAELIQLVKNGGTERALTMAMLGKSGVGKSAIVNSLQCKTGIKNEDGSIAREGRQRRGDLQGRHTTSSSRIYSVGNGLLLADLPGLRELKIWGEEEQLDHSFPDIHELAEDCRFRDCRHEHEPGCAVKQAIREGRLSERRFKSYLKLLRELAYLERRRLQEARKGEKR